MELVSGFRSSLRNFIIVIICIVLVQPSTQLEIGNEILIRAISKIQKQMNQVSKKLGRVISDQGELKKAVENVTNTLENLVQQNTETSNTLTSNIDIMGRNLPRANAASASWNTTPPSPGGMCGCPESEGFIRLPGSDQCYKALLDQERSWMDAGEKCKSNGLALAEPKNSIEIRKHLNGLYGEMAFWVGGRGTGISVQYQRGGGQLCREDPLWIQGHPDSQGYTAAQCLIMSALGSHLRSYPSAPFFTYACSDTRLAYALCEVVSR